MSEPTKNGLPLDQLGLPPMELAESSNGSCTTISYLICNNKITLVSN